jgi:hypothetical protein
MAMQRMQARPYALATILVRLPPVMKCLAAVEPGTDQVLSMDRYRCPYGNDAVLGIQLQQGNPEKVVRRSLIIGDGAINTAILIQTVVLYSARR